MNKIAVLLSVYKNDTLKQLEECIESLFNQANKNFDIYIQEDGFVPEDIHHYLSNLLQQNNISYLGTRNENRGLASSLNDLLKLTLEKQYKYIARMDADDICTPDRFELQHRELEQNPDIDICGGFIEEFNEQSNKKQVVKYKIKHDDIKAHLKKQNPIAHVTTFIRSSFFNTTGLYDPTKNNEDLDLWIRGLSLGLKFHNIPKVLVRVRTGDDFFSRRRNFKRAKEVMTLKIKATRLFGFGPSGYFYAIAHFFLFVSPGWIKKVLYEKMRG